MIDFNWIRNNNLLLVRYRRGSKIYSLDTPDSDEDFGGVFMEPLNSLLGLGLDFPENIHDEKQDEQWYCFKKYGLLLGKSNPNIFDSIFIDESHYDYMHPAFRLIRDNRDKFLSKDALISYGGYAKSQIEKAVKLKSRIVNPVFEKLSPLDFVYHPYKQGSRKIKYWLEERGLMQEHCGLTKIPHMDSTYNVYYDWGAHWIDKGVTTWEEFKRILTDPRTVSSDVKEFLKLTDAYVYYYKGSYSFVEFNEEKIKDLYEKYKTPLKYHGIISRDGDSEQVRYSSVPFKDEEPMTLISYNKDEFCRHRKQYKEYTDWKKWHNPERFLLATEHKYDVKNLMHCMRLYTQAVELAQGKGIILDRRGIDRDYLMAIRGGKVTYEEILETLAKKEKEMEEALKTCILPEHVDLGFLQSLMIKLRTEFYGL